jgi:preprotein translocase subunit YajC
VAAPGGGPAGTTATVGRPEQPQGPSGVAAFFASPIFLLILMFVVFYFLLIRPQQKKQKEHQKLLQNLKKGDEIVTASGIFGKIAGLTDTVATIEIADKVRVKILRSQIAGLSSGAATPQDAKAPAAPVTEQK